MSLSPPSTCPCPCSARCITQTAQTHRHGTATAPSAFQRPAPRNHSTALINIAAMPCHATDCPSACMRSITHPIPSPNTSWKRRIDMSTLSNAQDKCKNFINPVCQSPTISCKCAHNSCCSPPVLVFTTKVFRSTDSYPVTRLPTLKSQGRSLLPRSSRA